MLELDHLIVFLPGPAAVDPAGLVVEPGIRHVGQGTRNRRIAFPDSYLELLWIDAPDEARASGLRFAERCAGTACPLGVVLRGRLPERSGFVEYRVPDGPTLQVRDDPDRPFLAVTDSDDLDRHRPIRRMAAKWINHGTAIVAAQISCPVPLDLPVPRVSFVRGEPALAVELSGRDEPLRFRPAARG